MPCRSANSPYLVIAEGIKPSTSRLEIRTFGCRGDQACVKIAETTRCDRACQQACKEYRFDCVMCYSVWGPKFEFQREQLKRGIK
jgi:hypothetical protein